MRFDEKDLDGPEELLEQGLRENELVEADEEDLGEVKLGEVLAEERENLVMIAMREILEGRHIVINDLALPQRELMALEALKTAVEGKDQKLSRFVFADDRRDLLEQALAVLQPLLMHDVTTEFQDLVARIGTLRTGLKDLEDAQDELLEANRQVGVVVTDGDKDDKPKPTSDDDVEWKMTLDKGPELPEVERAPTSLTGKELPAEKPVPSTLDRGGPDAPELVEAPTTLGTKQDFEGVVVVEPQKLAAKTAPWWKPPRR